MALLAGSGLHVLTTRWAAWCWSPTCNGRVRRASRRLDGGLRPFDAPGLLQSAEVSANGAHTAPRILPCFRLRTTLSYMKNATVTIRLDPKLQRQLDRLSKRLGRSRSELVRDALRRQIAILRFEETRRELLPLAEAKGIVTDDDVIDLVS